MKQWFLIFDMLKALTKDHQAKKSKTFTDKHICEIIIVCEESDDPKKVLMGDGIGISYFGLLRKTRCVKIQMERVPFEQGRYKVRRHLKRKTGA